MNTTTNNVIAETLVEEFDSQPTIYRLKENGTVITEQSWDRFEGYYEPEIVCCDTKAWADYYWPKLVSLKTRDCTSPDYVESDIGDDFF